MGVRPARILIMASDDLVWAGRRRFESLGAHVEVLAGSRPEAVAACENTPDVIVLDLNSQDEGWLGVLRSLKRNPATHDIPVIVLASTDETDERISSLQEGAADCVARSYTLAELIARTRVLLQTRSRDDLLRRRISFLEELAASDPLTSLLNRRAFIDCLHLEMEKAARNEHPLSCLILDIDWFKSVNDRYGHQVGDDVLRHIAKVMDRGRQKGDAMCRYGGDEFVWLLPEVDRGLLLERSEWLRRTISGSEIPTTEGSFGVTVSIGASTYLIKEHGRVSAHLLLDQADAALLDAKKQGKNRIVFREPLPSDHAGEEVPLPAIEDLFVEPAAGAQAAIETATQPEPTPGGSVAVSDARDPRLREELRSLLDSSMKVLTAALEAKDPETMRHCRRVSSVAVAIAREMKLPTEEVERIRLASLVHDLGKLAVSDTILLKPTPLTSEEWAIVKKHPERGAAMLQEARAFSDLAELVLYHQESFDGTGFPSGLAGCEIPLGARIIRVADAFDALISDRPYRSRKELAEAKADLRQMAGTALDPKVVESLLRLLATIRPVDRQITAW
jgi:diguanylate cyclase (GGDEF)-like protein